ncbi:MAG: RNA-binding S4 domain-containing protein [Gemmatimonadaceae bacterium]|nr:RNA-binding S4 domain-containing protein [Gemmatimonadaceae bacterium]
MTTHPEGTPLRTDPVRLDKWLWAARFYKTRSIAAEAVDGGKVYVNGERAKPAKSVRPGDTLRLRLGPYEHVVEVLGTSERRGPAPEAQRLYRETDDSRKARERLHWQLTKAAPAMEPAKGRPTKRDRRDLDRFRDR